MVCGCVTPLSVQSWGGLPSRLEPVQYPSALTVAALPSACLGLASSSQVPSCQSVQLSATLAPPTQ